MENNLIFKLENNIELTEDDKKQLLDHEKLLNCLCAELNFQNANNYIYDAAEFNSYHLTIPEFTYVDEGIAPTAQMGDDLPKYVSYSLKKNTLYEKIQKHLTLNYKNNII